MKRQTDLVLLIEDDPNDQLFVTQAFRTIRGDYPVVAVSGGDEAIRYFKGEGHYSDRHHFPAPGLVITDLKMPGGDGFCVLEFLREHPLLAPIPTLVLSGSSDTDDIKKAYLMGCHSYFIKPVDFGHLLELVQKIHSYWLQAEVPQVDEAGYQKHTESCGKLGERISPPE